MPAKSITHHIEWPIDGSPVTGPTVWCRGWVVGDKDRIFCDIRVRSTHGVHWGIIGFPRPDLASHFGSDRPWLPAGFAVGIPLPDGATKLEFEVQDEFGGWSTLAHREIVVASNGTTGPQEVGQVVVENGATWTVVGARLPFHGHLDTDHSTNFGQSVAYGWLIHSDRRIRRLFGSAGLSVFNQLLHPVADPTLAQKIAHLPRATEARFSGKIDWPVTMPDYPCLRIYAELDDGSTHLVLTQRRRIVPPNLVSIKYESIADRLRQLPRLDPTACGRPRRALLALASLERTDAARRALDICRCLKASGRWLVRLVATTAGEMRSEFEAAGVPLQLLSSFDLMKVRSQIELARAIDKLDREVTLTGLDAVAIFEPLSFWAAALAQRHQIPAVYDAVEGRAFPTSDEAPEIWQSSQTRTWKALSRLIWPDWMMNEADRETFRDTPISIVPAWYDPGLVESRVEPRESRDLLLSPGSGSAHHGAAVVLQALDHVKRHHPEIANRWRIAFPEVRDGESESQFVRDLLANQPTMAAIEKVQLSSCRLCVTTAFAHHPVRTTLNALALGIPVGTTISSFGRMPWRESEINRLTYGNPLSVAHLIAAFTADPGPCLRKARMAQCRVRRDHDPKRLMRCWQLAFESSVSGSKLYIEDACTRHSASA